MNAHTLAHGLRDAAANTLRMPLTDAQAEKWIGSRFSADAAAAFNESCELVLTGALDDAALVAAMAAVARRHEAFRLGFAADGSAQVLQRPEAFPLDAHDLRGATDPMAAHARLCAALAALPFDLARPPLLRMVLCRVADDTWRLRVHAHHIVCDGWSLRVCARDLAAHYNRQLGRRAVTLPRVDAWTDYAIAERARRAGPDGEASLAYWLRQFAQRPEPLRLPTDRPRGASVAFAAGRVDDVLPAELWRALKTTAVALGVTRFSLLLAAYVALLHRLTGQQDIVCGVPFVGAALGSGSRVMGDTVNTLPLRLSVADGVSMGDLARQAHVALRDAAVHQHVSLGRIVDALHVPREPGRLLLVETMLTLNPAILALDFDGLQCRLETPQRAVSPWEIAVHCKQTPGAVALEAQFHSSLYDASTIAAWMRWYVGCLRATTLDATLAVSDVWVDVDAGAGAGVDAARDADRRATHWSLPAPAMHGIARDVSVVALLDAAFAAFADRRAATSGDASISYRALDAASRRVADALRADGVGRGALVGVCLPRGLAMLATVIGVLRSGAAYVPLDPQFPPARLLHMASHARLSTIVVAAVAQAPTCLRSGWRLLSHAEIDARAAARGSADASLPAASPTAASPMAEVHANDLAYVLYTSGSTGEPKGVRMLHRSLANFLQSMRVSPGFGPDDAICAATTLSFDIAALELYLPLLCGGRVVIADDAQCRDPAALCRLVETSGCTVLQTTPSLLALLLDVGRLDTLRPLRLLVGGEALPPALARSLRGRCRALWNMYGPTETTVWSTIARIHADADAVADIGTDTDTGIDIDTRLDIDIDIDTNADADADAVRPGAAASDRIALGQPIAGTRVYLLDARRRPALPGAIGEIWIAGAGVADGYLHDAALTAERFVADPFAPVDGGQDARMYRTGDLGRLHRGALSYHGRIDAQIKLRGYRIEPGEIEAVALRDPAVAECVAVAMPVAGDDCVLVLHVVPQAHAEAAALPRALRDRLRDALPGYMRPQHIVLLDALPKTPNGKIDRSALRPPIADAAQGDAAFAGPRDAIESGLCALWRTMMARESVGIHDDFFELGGYSLMAVRLFAEINDRHGVDLPLATLIERPTIAGLSDVIRAAQSQRVVDAVPGGERPAVASDTDRWDNVVTMQRGGARPPLFLFHAVGGNVLNYLTLLPSIGRDQPVYGLQASGLDGRAPPLASIAAMADRYAAAIRRAVPDGPYLLGGSSMGGTLAFEVARRLRAQGQQIPLLVMFDTYGPRQMAGMSQLLWPPHRAYRRYAALHPEQRSEFWRRVRFRLFHLPWLTVTALLRGGRVQPVQRRIHRVEQTNLRALSAYVAEPFAGPVVLFRTRVGEGETDPAMGWSAYARGGVTVVELPGRHDNFVGHPELAARLRSTIDACTTTDDTP